jgi:hypothetical protein
MKYNIDPRHPQELSNPPENLALTGRVADWLTSPDGRLPVSCTVLDVQDSMEGHEGIEYGWLFTSHGLRNGAGVALNLNNLRPAGSENGKGLTASGAVSFLKIFNVINEVLRRGGLFKNGAITAYLDYDNKDVVEFLTLNTKEYAWVKRALYIDDNIFDSPHLDLILDAVDKGYIWLAKKQYDNTGNRLYSNVCTEIVLKSRGSCLISNINLGLTTIASLSSDMVEGMDYLCKLHNYTSVERTNYYLPQQEDRQVGLGFIGLSNFLAINKIKYLEFVEALENLERDSVDFNPERIETLLKFQANGVSNLSLPDEAALSLVSGFIESSKVARAYKMERAFTVAPTASSFTRHFDLDGYSVSPEISPPIGREIERASETFGTEEYEFNPDCEIAFEVGWDTQFRLVNIWQRLMDSTGLAHAISMNVWSTKKVDRTFLQEFMDSAVKTTYYRMAINQYSNDKSSVVSDETLEKMASVYANEDSDTFLPEPVTEYPDNIDPSCGCPIDPIERMECSACDGS